MFAMKLYRVSNYLSKKKLKFLSKVFEKLNFIINNCEIPAEVEIGKNCVFGHEAIGSVINKDSKIGSYVMIGQNVTIGGKSGQNPPKIEDNVYIGPGVRILGDVKIGQNSIIGANAVVLKDIPKNSVYAGIPAKKIVTIDKFNFEKYKMYFLNNEIEL